MSTIMRKSGMLPSTSFIDDFLSRNIFDWSDWTSEGSSVPKVNIEEASNEFKVEMAAPGMRREDFHIELDNDMLTISAESQDEQNAEGQNYTRREFRYESFKRSFYLPKTVEADEIKAKYKDGLLSLIIPKKEEARKKPVKTISIS